MHYNLKFFVDKKGKCYFTNWLESLSGDNQKRVEKRLRRVESGNLGDYKSLGKNLFELKFDFGAGYIVYFSIEEKVIILLLCGGDKSGQSRDIAKAKEHLEDYYERKSN